MLPNAIGTRGTNRSEMFRLNVIRSACWFPVSTRPTLPEMAHSLIAYIDESGDDGLAGNYRQQGVRGGSSTWLTIAASVWRHSLDAAAVVWRDEIRKRLGAQAQTRALHFKDLGHNQRIMAAQVVATKPIRAVCVMANKPLLPRSAYAGKNALYFDISRYVIERVSWLCRDMRARVREGDGRARIVFSRRGGLSYAGFRDYLNRLKETNDQESRIDWSVIDVDGIEAADHASLRVYR